MSKVFQVGIAVDFANGDRVVSTHKLFDDDKAATVAAQALSDVIQAFVNTGKVTVPGSSVTVSNLLATVGIKSLGVLKAEVEVQGALFSPEKKIVLAH